MTRRSRRYSFILGALALVLVVAGVAWRWMEPASRPTTTAAAAPLPVTVGAARQQDVPIVLDALGTVQASNTVAIRSQIDGKLQTVKFTEGQDVKQGDVLAIIDPRSLQAALDQTTAKKAQDQAMLTAAQKDLARFQSLGTKGYETQQNIDQQQAKVDQLKATLDADQAAIENAQTQLSYATITAPIDGRVGFRQVDAGNIVRANDPNPLTVLTTIRPALTIFTLPQSNLGGVREAMLRGSVPAIAFDQDNTHELSRGEVSLIDNQIDQTTSTIRLKATFANTDARLWPGEFVHLRVQVDTRKGAVTVPPVALQRGPQGYYVWVVRPDSTVEQRPVEAMAVNDQVAIVTKGVASGERVVVNGQYRLQAGARVDPKVEEAASAPGEAS